MSASKLLERLLEPGSLSVALEPIFELREGPPRLHALEALVAGPKHTNLERGEILFEYARRKHQESLIDRASVCLALEGARRQMGDAQLSLNVHAATLARDSEFAAFLEEHAALLGIELTRLIVGIIQPAAGADWAALRAVLDGLRRIGVGIAIDRVGIAHSDFRMILECGPHYFKIDPCFVQGAHADFYRLTILESISKLAHRFGGRAVAPGVSSAADLAVLVELGIDLVQGELFSRPAACGAPPPLGR